MAKKYPLAVTKEARGRIKKMKPQAFLDAARPLKESRGDRAIIDKFKGDIERGAPLGALKIAENYEDGRHRATAAKELGVKSVPVVDERDGKKRGGPVLRVPTRLPIDRDDLDADLRRLALYSYAVAPLGPARGGYAGGGDVSLPRPFVTGMSPEGYPVFPSDLSAYGNIAQPYVKSFTGDGYPTPFGDPLRIAEFYSGPSRRRGYQEGGDPEFSGEVTAAPEVREDDIARAEARAAYDFSPVVDYMDPKTIPMLKTERERTYASPSEFIRHQLDTGERQLPQYDREAVEAWKEGAKGLGHMAAYGIPVAGPALGAYDLAMAARDLPELRKAYEGGDYASMAATLGGLGLAALGAPGKAAKAAAAAGALLMPEEAQSSPFSDAAKEALAVSKKFGLIRPAGRVGSVYHGSPVGGIKNFDLSKIGSGVGEQNFGWGINVAENEPTARFFKDYVSGPQSGAMYELNINRPREHFIDWSKPVSEQSSEVQEVLSSLNIPREEEYWRMAGIHGGAGPATRPVLGSGAYNAIANRFQDPNFNWPLGMEPISNKYAAASELLKQKGIAGTRFPDTRDIRSNNYSVFDPKDIEILREYKNYGGEVGARNHMAGGGRLSPDAIKAAIALGERAANYMRGSVSPEQRMMVMHQVSPMMLPKIKEMGGMPSPSLGLGMAQHSPLESFGDVTLLGHPHLAMPNEVNPVYGQDVWTPTVPPMRMYDPSTLPPSHPEPFTGMGFFSSVKRRAVPGTAENVLEHMLARPTIGGEYLIGHHDEPDPSLGYVMSALAPRFKSLREMGEARGRLEYPTEVESMHDALMQRHDKLAAALNRGSDFEDEGENAGVDRLGRAILDYERRKGSTLTDPLKQNYPSISAPQREWFQRHVEDIRNFPTSYFEAKPRRIVEFGEFGGAAVPEEYMPRVSPILEQMGIKKVVPYSGERSRALEQFPELSFKYGGAPGKQEGGQLDGGDYVSRAMDLVSRLNPIGEARAETPKAAIAKSLMKAAAPAISKIIPLEEAQARVASPFSADPEVVKLARQYAETLKVPQGGETVSGSFYNIKQPRPVSDVTSTVVPLTGVSPIAPRNMTWEDFVREAKGGTLINVAGDRSDLGLMTDINNRRLAWDVGLHAGPKYMLEPNPQAVWANNPAHATSFWKAIQEASKRGPVFGAYHPMGVQSVDSSHNMIDALLAQIALGDVSKKDMRAADRILRAGAHAEADKQALAKEALAGWPGFENAQEASEFARGLEGTRRSEIVKFLDKAPRLREGFPAVGETRVAITDPALRGTSGNLMGHRIVQFDPENLVPSSLAFKHSTYPSPTGGRYVGDVPLVQSQYVMPDVAEGIMTKLAKGDRVVHPYSYDPLGRSSWRKSLETRKLGQEINDRMLDSIMLGLQRQRDYGLRKGGSVIQHALDVSSKVSRRRVKEAA